MGSTARGADPDRRRHRQADRAAPSTARKAERWVVLDRGRRRSTPQNFQFTTPNEAPPDERCGKVVFSDMHVSGGLDVVAEQRRIPDGCVGGDR